MKLRAAIWLVNGERFERETVVSCASVGRTMPDLARHIFVVPRSTPHWYADQLAFLVKALPDLPAEVLLLDSDTYLIDSVYELFFLLGNYDLAAAHAPGRKTASTVQPIPECFPEWNTGVMPMRNTQKVRDFFARVHQQLVENVRVYGDNDQAPFREVLWSDQQVRIATLPPEYHCRHAFGAFVRDRVRILHGRGHNFEKVAASINAKQGEMRLWRP